MAPVHLQDAVELIRMEYAEMPNLRLTFWQAQRLWDLSSELCEEALTLLIRSGFLTRAFDGAYVRSHRAEPRVDAARVGRGGGYFKGLRRLTG